MSDVDRPTASPSQTVGPFFHFGLAANSALGQIAPVSQPGQRIRLRVRVLDGDGTPVPDAVVEVYQADAHGAYPRPTESQTRESVFTGFGRLATNEEGLCVFETIRPGRVGAGAHRVQAPHLNVCLFARGLLRHLYTRIYFADDAERSRDPILRLVPSNRWETLLAARAAEDEHTWDFVIRLQGDRETVFFDL